MLRTSFGPGRIRIDRGRHSRLRFGVARQRQGWLYFPLPLALAAGLAGGAHADPVPVVSSGIPPQVVPTYPEVGAPQFSFPAGNTGTGGGGTGSAGGGTGTGGGGYTGAGGTGTGTLASNYSSLVGQSVGSGECVALVQATSNVGLTATWVPGELVQGNTELAPGTVIATFGSEGTYTNTPGQSHAAIYLEQDTTGIWVEDQWAGQVADRRHINWTTSNAYESGSQFYVVSH